VRLLRAIAYIRVVYLVAAGFTLSAKGTGTGTGAGAGIAFSIAGFSAIAFNLSRLFPSPNKVAEIMNNIKVIAMMINRVGFFIKNNGHFGLYIPRQKISIVHINKVIAPLVIEFILLTYSTVI
jgi:hypothetical protein